MDSLTQIVLGAGIGEAVLGRKAGNKALLYGALAGTIPDFDVLASYFTDTVTALAIHRGFTHSIFFSILFAPVFGWIVSSYETYKNFKSWSWLFFWAFLTHPILDAHTTWGTQLFWPFDLRLAFKTIFVIDPLYTLPFLACLLLVLFQKRNSKKRRLYNTLGLSNYDKGSNKSGSFNIVVRDGYQVKLKFQFETKGDREFLNEIFSQISKFQNGGRPTRLTREMLITLMREPPPSLRR